MEGGCEKEEKWTRLIQHRGTREVFVGRDDEGLRGAGRERSGRING